LVVLAAPLAALAADPAFPALTGRVVDAANIIPADARARIEAKLKAYEDKTSDQVVVATVPSLGDLTIEDYANRLFRHWAIGQKKLDNGVLLLVAPKERKVRIEVGYGAEGALTDAASSIIINRAIAPKFRQGDFAGGIEAGVDAIIAVLSPDAAESGRHGLPRNLSEGTSDAFGIFGPILFILAIMVIAHLIQRAQMNGARYHRTRGGSWIVTGGGLGGWGGGFGSGGGGFSGGGGGFSGGGGSSGGGGASGSW
jgi:uncharacterized protein